MIGISRSSGGRAPRPGVERSLVPQPRSAGRWALSRIVQDPDGGYRVAASVQRLATDFDVFYPPMTAGRTGFTQTHALVRFLSPIVGTPDADTDLLPDLLLDAPLGLFAGSVRALLEARCPRYRYVDWTKAVVGKPLIPVAGYTVTTPFREVLRDIWQHLEHSTVDPRVQAIPESHNTEYTDDFATDTRANYVAKLGTIGHDGTDLEIDVGMANNWGFHYNGSEPGSIEHEAQATVFYGSAVVGGGSGAGAVRFHTTEATDDWYYGRVFHDSDTMSLRRMNGGTASAELASRALTAFDASTFYTLRMAAVGAAGAAVTLSFWFVNHGTSKPTDDPGWLSTGALTDYEDSSASGTERLDSSSHAKGGVAGHWQGVDFDNRVDWFKVRAISDRGGAAPAGHPTMRRWSGIPGMSFTGRRSW